ncbi:MAG: asparagine synthase C-terminal domain-containing protein [Lachnospiraceae bacterium]|nr:asparagine synthase C-terminal domain-containing protein [Lachnospiraceae bacterium]
MIIDKTYCMSSFLQMRTVADENKCFAEGLKPNFYDASQLNRELVHDSFELEAALEKHMKAWTADGKAALALSGGIDSAVLASMMPKGSVAYTFRCVVPGKQFHDETTLAASYCEKYGLEHRIVDIYWEDFEKYTETILKHKGMPMHSIEVQIYKAALQAKAEGFERFIFGQSADLNFGGLSKILSRDWTFGEFVDRYSYVMPYTALKDYTVITEPFLDYVDDKGYVDVHEFLRNFTLKVDMGSYVNACETAGIEMLTPYVLTKMAHPLDLERVRRGENKYLIREVFERRFAGFVMPEKLPMPRPMNEWFADWEGPTRDEFWPHCTDNMNGDQRWIVWVLEKFLNLIDPQ